MRRAIDIFVIVAGCGALVAEIAMLLATAYLRGGHPPASGIVVLLMLHARLFGVSPLPR